MLRITLSAKFRLRVHSFTGHSERRVTDVGSNGKRLALQQLVPSLKQTTPTAMVTQQTICLQKRAFCPGMPIPLYVLTFRFAVRCQLHETGAKSGLLERRLAGSPIHYSKRCDWSNRPCSRSSTFLRFPHQTMFIYAAGRGYKSVCRSVTLG